MGIQEYAGGNPPSRIVSQRSLFVAHCTHTLTVPFVRKSIPLRLVIPAYCERLYTFGGSLVITPTTFHWPAFPETPLAADIQLVLSKRQASWPCPDTSAILPPAK